MEFMIFSGGFFILVGAFISGSYPKKSIFLVLFTLSIATNLFIVFSPWFWATGVALTLDYALKTIMVELRYCYIMEVTDSKLRGKFMVVVVLFYSLGMTLNGLVFEWLKNWRLVVMVTQIGPLVLLGLVLAFVLVDTPFDLILFSDKKKALEGLDKMARINKKEDFNLKLEDV